MKKIMILGASILQLPGIKKAKEMGLSVVAVDMDKNAVGFKEDIEKEVISTIDIPAVIEAAKRHKVDGVITLASDMPMRTVAAVAEELKIPGVSKTTALRATDKAEMVKCLKAAGVPVPDFYVAENEEDYNTAVQKVKKPFIVKPTDNSGSRGVSFLDFDSSKEKINAAYFYGKEFSRNGNVLVEEFMRGPEVSVETMTADGVCRVIQITDKLTTGAPHFVEMGHSQPTRLPLNVAEKIKQTAIAANKAIGITSGPSHTEIIVTEEGPKIVEIGARLGGDCITTHLVPLSTGVDMVECIIKTALGETPDLTPKFNKGSAIRYLHQTPGVVKGIDGVTAASAVQGVKQISFPHGIGQQITEIDSSAARMGFVIADGETAAEAVKVCETALSLIKVTME